MVRGIKGFEGVRSAGKNLNVIVEHCFLHREGLLDKTLLADLVPVLDDFVRKLCEDTTCEKSHFYMFVRGKGSGV